MARGDDRGSKQQRIVKSGIYLAIVLFITSMSMFIASILVGIGQLAGVGSVLFFTAIVAAIGTYMYQDMHNDRFWQ